MFQAIKSWFKVTFEIFEVGDLIEYKMKSVLNNDLVYYDFWKMGIIIDIQPSQMFVNLPEQYLTIYDINTQKEIRKKYNKKSVRHVE